MSSQKEQAIGIRKIIRPAIGRHYVKQAIIGSKTEPYYPGEDFDYKPPTYRQILKEYERI